MKPSPKQIALSFGLLLSGALTGQIGQGKPDRWRPTAENYENEDHLSVRPVLGFVPDAKTAKEIAMTILCRHVPPEEIKGAEPFEVADMKGYWVVYGYFPASPNAVGGTIIVEVDRESGAILRFSREQ